MCGTGIFIGAGGKVQTSGEDRLFSITQLSRGSVYNPPVRGRPRPSRVARISPQAVKLSLLFSLADFRLSVLCAGLQEFEGVKVGSFECILKLSLLEEGIML